MEVVPLFEDTLTKERPWLMLRAAAKQIWQPM
jgi:hypothetical protein